MIFLHNFYNKSALASLYCTATLISGLLMAAAPAPASAQEAIRPLLLLQDAKRLADGRRQDPRQLQDLVATSPSAWVRQEAARKLAGYHARKGEWEDYRKVAGYADHCALLLLALHEGDPAKINQAVQDALLDADVRDQNCMAALQRASAAGFLADRDVWRRIRILIEERKTRDAVRLLGLLKDDKASAATLRNAVNNATGRLLRKKRVRLASRVDQELLAVSALVAAMYSRTPKRVEQVAARWAEYAELLDADLSTSMWPYVGKWQALNLNFELARQSFEQAPLTEHSRLALAWRARTGMRLGDWRMVAGTIEAMQGEQRTLSAWRYWYAYAWDQLGRRDRARKLMLGVARDFDDYYGLLAKESVGMRTALGARQPRADLMEQLREDADVRMALALGLRNRTKQARQVWKFLLRKLGDAEILALAALASEEGWLLGSINAADYAKAANSSHALRFPTPSDHAEAIAERAAKDGIPPEFVYAIIRQESRFNAKAVSSAGARGLMQVMPRTARLVASKHKFTRYNLSRLTLVKPNVTIGVRYMADLSSDYDGDPIRISAAYNAGPTNLRRWLRRSEGVDRRIFIETIPFTETRLYVKAVLANYHHYGWLLHAEGMPMSATVAGSY